VLLARVALPVPLGQAFTYSVGAELEAGVRRGARVLCELGRRRAVGVVLDVSERAADVPEDKLKPILAVVDAEPALPEELLGFLQELARYYVAPIGDVMELALPAVERSAAAPLYEPATGRTASLFGDDEKAPPARVVGKLVQVVSAVPGASGEAPRGQAREILAHLRDAGAKELRELEERWPSARGAVAKLEKAGLVAIARRAESVDPFTVEVLPDAPPELNAQQERAVRAIAERLERAEPRSFLLEGVTASGKTEVYLRAAERCLALGRGVLVLVPEIALTPQLVGRFRARLGKRIAVIHSGLGERARHAMWRSLRSGEARVAVGARSALFAPLADLGLVCVDEEHDGSFKQEEGVRYHARDMAILRAHRAGAVCLLGSATPSVTTIELARQGKLEHLELPARAVAASRLPEVEIVDLRRLGPGLGGERLLTLPLVRALERTLAAKDQAILFLNRRGFSPSLLCEACGEIAECPNCSVALTLHRAHGRRLVCHYCDYSTPVPEACPSCKEPSLVEEGAGTERIESTLATALPNARIARLDRDVAAGLKSEKVLERVRRGEIDVLVGTQMVTKGHDLPNVTLVGVLNADASLGMPDFRAAERTFQLLVQVAGRAGRGERPGRVLIQTYQPHHPAIELAARHDVKGFAEAELAARRELRYPPFARVALVRFDATEEAVARDAADKLATLARKWSEDTVEILGPAPAPLARLRNRYRYRFLVRSVDRTRLHIVLLAVARSAVDRRVRMAIDVDPVSML
jgi:primosomal protein N' (replication factor Y)